MWGFWLKLESLSPEGSFGFQQKALILCISENFFVSVFGLQIRDYSSMKNCPKYLDLCILVFLYLKHILARLFLGSVNFSQLALKWSYILAS